MIYRKFKDLEISSLGMGAMRLPQTEAGGPIDDEAAMALIEHAWRSGINYYDSGYFYHSGKSDAFMGRALARFPRDSWYLANKLPGNMMTYIDGVLRLEVSGFGMESKTLSHVSEVFEEQLALCGVDYFDFYLLHNIAENTFDLYTNEELGIVEYLLAQKKAGRIKHLGFSAHGRAETIEAFLDHLSARGQACAMEFCMIQINYLDWTLQEADKKYELLTKRGIPVFAMEPTRGGKLCQLTGPPADILAAARPNDTQAAWAFRYLQSLENMHIVISGMSNMEQLVENLALFGKTDPITGEDADTLNRAVAAMADFVPCTACGYCIAACPANLDIPTLLSLYNEAGYEVSWTLKNTLRMQGEDKQPKDCICCGNCNPLCSQNIDIPQALTQFAKLLG